MTDTDKYSPSRMLPLQNEKAVQGPAIVLIEPQLGENIGAVARAMLNFGISDLRLVRPRDGWPNDKTNAAAAGADIVISRAQLFESTEDAIADLNRVYASSGRTRDLVKQVLSPAQAVEIMQSGVASGEASGVLFGPERSGLPNTDLALADAVINIPANSQFKSLNLAMAVLVVCYEWSRRVDEPAAGLIMGKTRAAKKSELLGLFCHLEGALDDCGFLRVREKRPHMVQNIRNIFQRAQLTEQEVRTLRGVISGLVNHPSERN